jgi:hypothetical protein
MAPSWQLRDGDGVALSDVVGELVGEMHTLQLALQHWAGLLAHRSPLGGEKRLLHASEPGNSSD